MFELLTLIVFFGLMFQTVKLAFRLTWGLAKIIASLLIVIALPMLALCMIFVGGLALLVPIAVVGIAWAILAVC